MISKCSMHPQYTVLSFVQLSTPNPRTRLNQFSAPWRTSLSDLSATDGPTVNNVASPTTSEVLQTAMQRFQACILKGDVSSRCLFTHFGCCLLHAEAALPRIRQTSDRERCSPRVQKYWESQFVFILRGLPNWGSQQLECCIFANFNWLSIVHVVLSWIEIGFDINEKQGEAMNTSGWMQCCNLWLDYLYFWGVIQTS